MGPVTGRAPVDRMKARGLPGKGRDLSRRLRVGNGWGRFRIAQLMSLAGADGSHRGRM